MRLPVVAKSLLVLGALVGTLTGLTGQINLVNGQVTGGPATKPLINVPVQVVDGQVTIA